MAHSYAPHMFGIIAIFIALGHSVVARLAARIAGQVLYANESPSWSIFKKRWEGHFRLQHGLHFTGSLFAVIDYYRRRPPGIFGKFIGAWLEPCRAQILVRLLFQAFVVVVGAVDFWLARWNTAKCRSRMEY